MRENDPDGRRLIWWLLGGAMLVGLGYAAWLGNAVTTLQTQVATLSAKVEIIVQDHARSSREDDMAYRSGR